jgi:hypothetical protein
MNPPELDDDLSNMFLVPGKRGFSSSSSRSRLSRPKPVQSKGEKSINGMLIATANA